MEPSEFCDEFKNLDLRWPDECKEALEDGPWDWCFNLAADMGGMGFIQSNHSRILFNSTMISFNVAEAARVAGVKRFWCAPPDPAARLGAQLGARKFVRSSARFERLLRRAALPPPSQVRVVGVHLPRVQAAEGGPRGRVGAEGGRRVARAAAGRVRPREADDRGAAHALRGGLRDGVPDRPLPRASTARAARGRAGARRRPPPSAARRSPRPTRLRCGATVRAAPRRAILRAQFSARNPPTRRVLLPLQASRRARSATSTTPSRASSASW